MIKTGIIGGLSPTMSQLIRLILLHPDTKLRWVADPQSVLNGKRVDEVFPSFLGDTALSFGPVPDMESTDLVILCCRHGRQFIPDELPPQLRVIDMCPDSLCPDGYTYGVCEMNRKFMVHDCYRVACPGGQAMGFLLGVLPLARNLLLNSELHVTSTLIGGHAGIYPELADNSDPASLEYVLRVLQNSFSSRIVMHTHTQEPVQGVEGVTTRITMQCPVTLDVLKVLYRDYYDDHNFTFVTDVPPAPAHVAGTNKCHIHLAKEGDTLVVTTVLDAHYKATAGNAVHVMNLLFGLHERVGLAPLLD